VITGRVFAHVRAFVCRSFSCIPCIGLNDLRETFPCENIVLIMTTAIERRLRAKPDEFELKRNDARKSKVWKPLAFTKHNECSFQFCLSLFGEFYAYL